MTKEETTKELTPAPTVAPDSTADAQTGTQAAPAAIRNVQPQETEATNAPEAEEAIVDSSIVDKATPSTLNHNDDLISDGINPESVASDNIALIDELFPNDLDDHLLDISTLNTTRDITLDIENRALAERLIRLGIIDPLLAAAAAAGGGGGGTISFVDTTAPVIEPIANQTVVEGNAIADITVVATDNSDNFEITILERSTPLPDGVTLDNATNVISGTPVVNWTGDTHEVEEFEIDVLATDTPGNTGVESFSIIVQRDTDGDGVPDVIDTDDDGDGILDHIDKQPKVKDITLPVIAAVDSVVVEGQVITPISIKATDNEAIRSVKTSILPAGLNFDEPKGEITGTPVKIGDWGTTEEERPFTVTVTATDTAGNVSTKDITITVQRDTDGDGVPDVTDTDDDGDGILDGDDKEPKVIGPAGPMVTVSDTRVTEGQDITPIPVTITEPEPEPKDVTDPVIYAENATVVEGQPITPISVTATDNEGVRSVDVTGLPAGLDFDKGKGEITGTPTRLTDWGPIREELDVPVTITAVDNAGNSTTETIIITLQRDTDGDGIPDVTDTDDDGDGILDTYSDLFYLADKDPKVPDTTGPVITVADATVIEGQQITPIFVTATDNERVDRIVVWNLPAGLTHHEAKGIIIGTPLKATNWGQTEEEREVPVTITATDSAGNVSWKEFTITVQRDTDGDGVPDVVDTDDDGDGILDDVDKDPKVADTIGPVIAAYDATVVEGPSWHSEVFIPITVTDNEGIKSVKVTSAWPDGVTYNEVTREITGTPTKANDWGPTEEEREVPVTITATDTAGNVTTETITITVQRDTDGDGVPDVVDTDDDSDGILDDVDKDPKVPDTTGPVINAADATVIEGQPITPISVSATDNEEVAKIVVTGLPAGLTHDEDTGEITGTPREHWYSGETEEEHSHTVTVNASDIAGNTTMKEFTITVQRDTDGDGVPDVTDTDDDGDGILDDVDKDPKVPDTIGPVIAAYDATVIEAYPGIPNPITPIIITVTDNEEVDKVVVTGLPFGLTHDKDTNEITGTPTRITDWGKTEEREFSVTITATDTAGNATTATITITVQRDTEGDGIPDVTDTDDDGDGILDDVDNDPKVPDPGGPTITVDDVRVVDGQVLAPIVITTTDPEGVQTVKVISALPDGLVFNEVTREITGTPTMIADWRTTEEERPFIATVMAIDVADNVSYKEFTIIIQRDTDGDGIPDVTDIDDDGDSILDGVDKEPKVKDTSSPVITVQDVSVVEDVATKPIQVRVTDNEAVDVVRVSGYPDGLTYATAESQVHQQK